MPDTRELLKAALDTRAQTWEQAKTLLDTTVDGEKTRDFTPEERKTWDDLNAELTKLDERAATYQTALDSEARAKEAREAYDKVALPEDRTDKEKRQKNLPVHATDEYREAFETYCRAGMGALTPEQRDTIQKGFRQEERAQGTGSGAAGGFTIPQGFYDRLTEAMKFYGGMLEPANLGRASGDGEGPPPAGENAVGVTIVPTTTGNDLPMPTMDDTANKGARLAENTVITQQDIAFGSRTMKAYIYTSKLILISWALLNDSAFDMGQVIPDVAGERLGRILNEELTTGSGTAMPEGVVTGAPVGKVCASGQVATIIYDDLVDLEHSVDPAYRPNGKYMFADTVLAILRKLKDSQGHPLWEPSLKIGVPNLFNGRRYVINNDSPSPAASVKSMLFGDFSNYHVRLVNEAALVRLEERYADALQTGFFVWIRADGALLNAGTNPVKALQQAAS